MWLPVLSQSATGKDFFFQQFSAMSLQWQTMEVICHLLTNGDVKHGFLLLLMKGRTQKEVTPFHLQSSAILFWWQANAVICHLPILFNIFPIEEDRRGSREGSLFLFSFSNAVLLPWQANEVISPLPRNLKEYPEFPCSLWQQRQERMGSHGGWEGGKGWIGLLWRAVWPPVPKPSDSCILNLVWHFQATLFSLIKLRKTSLPHPYS